MARDIRIGTAGLGKALTSLASLSQHSIMSKPSSIGDGSSSPDPFITDVNSKEEATPTQELTQEEARSKHASSKTADHDAVSAQVDANNDGGTTAWGGEEMPPPPPTLRRQSTSERSAQTTVAQVRDNSQPFSMKTLLLISKAKMSSSSKLTLPT